ncbi:glycosyltransferase family 1 protein [Lysobacter sp. FW306-1B-D06B]|uniref:glycosyltransferase family 4 protein n=1 Tax=Lysobacter sp. FW306-1B-D06B TaxID=3140250 RepID=UPI003140C0AB
MKILVDLLGAQTQSHRRGIGRYTRDLVRALLDIVDDRHEIHFALSSPLDGPSDALIAEFGTRVSPHRIHWLRLPYETAAYDPANQWRRCAGARLMRHQLEALRPDWVLHTSVVEGFSDDALVPDRPVDAVRTASVLYDLIPLHVPELLPEAKNRDWYEERLTYLKRSDLLVAISEWTRRDAISLVGLEEDQAIFIGTAVDPRFTPAAATSPAGPLLKARMQMQRPFVMYAGGFDQRKNVNTLLDAYARLPVALREGHQLLLAGHVDPTALETLRFEGRRLGLGEDDVLITGSVSDEELAWLYASCALFVFPSLMEGFGLPPLEAMACGAPVLASSATSIPEVIGREDLLFNPDDPGELAQRMARVLSDAAFAAELRDYGPRRASEFDMKRVAARMLAGMERKGGEPPLQARPAAERVATQTPHGLPSWLPASANAAAASPHGAPSTNDPIGLTVLRTDTMPVAAVAEAAAARPCVVLLGESLRKTTAEDARAGIYVASGYAALAAADRSGIQPALSAWAPSLREAVAIVAQTPALAEQARALLGDEGHPRVFEASSRWQEDVVHECGTSERAREARLIEDIIALPGSSTHDDLAQIAYGIAASRATRGERWFVDVSTIAVNDIGTGVHRVVRSVLRSWLQSPPPGVRIEPVRFDRGSFRYARAYTTKLLGLPALALQDAIAEPAPGDMFVGLDWSPEAISAALPRLQDWRRAGVRTAFVVNDLMPMRLPEFFHAYSRVAFEQWLGHMSSVADGVACISRATAQDYRAWLQEAQPAFQFGRAPDVGTFAMGVDSHVLEGSDGDLRPTLRDALAKRPTVLMVGTLEPRKRHEDALDVADRLWARGLDFNLVVAGQRGWLTDALIARMKAHPRLGQSLHWHEDVGDRELGALYRKSTLLLAASAGEGYGLPLIEAARHGLAVVARDLPVFREVMGDSAQYLAPDPALWDEPLTRMLSAPLPPAAQRSWPSWDDCANELAALLRQVRRQGAAF